MRPHPLPLMAAALAGAAALTLAACGGGSGSGAYGDAGQGPATTTAAGSTATLSAAPNGALAFDTTSLRATAGMVTLKMTNPSGSGIAHAIAVEGNGVDRDGATARPGGTSVVTVTLPPGTYTFYCPVPGHEDAGMKGTLTVS